MRQTHPHFRSETWNVTKTLICNWTGTSEVAFKAFRFIYFLHLRIKSQYHYSVGVECTVVQLFASMSAWVQEFGHRGLAILFLGPEGHFDKLDRLEWYQDSEEELLIVPLCVFVRMWKFECGLLLHLWLCLLHPDGLLLQPHGCPPQMWSGLQILDEPAAAPTFPADVFCTQVSLDEL